MNILVYGAGVVGSVYAAKLQEAGQNVSLLARGPRAESLRTNGIQLEDSLTGSKTATRVSVVENLAPTASYDVVLVTVRQDHLASILPVLAANHQISTFVFLLNNPAGIRDFEQLDKQRVVQGFPAVGGARIGEVVRYMIIRQVAMMLAKPDEGVTPRLRELATVFKQGGFKVKFSSDMQAWLKTHALVDINLIPAVIRTGGSAKLARSRPDMVLFVQGIREGMLALKALGTPPTPFFLVLIFLWFPRWLTVLFWQGVLRTRLSRLGIDVHLDDDLGEIRSVGREMLDLFSKSSRPTPTLKRLVEALEQPGGLAKPHATTGNA